jgi:type I restriction enzyme S subunit
MAALSELCDNVKMQCAPEDDKTGVYVGLEHLDSGSFFLTRHGSPAEVRSAKFCFQRGDILYGKLRPYLDKAVIAERDGICSTDILVLRPKVQVVGLFLLGLLHSRASRSHAIATTHGVNHPRTSWPGLATFSPDVPSRSDQERAAALFESLQRGMVAEQTAAEATMSLKRAVMHSLLSQGLSRGDVTDTPHGSVPAHWSLRPLGDCCVVQSGVTKGRRLSPSESIEVPYLRVANVQDGRLDLSEIKTIAIRRDERERFLLRDGDVLLTEGGDLDKLGRGFIWRSELPECVHQNHIFAVRTNRNVLMPEFLAYLSQSVYGRAYFLSVAHKTTNLASINLTKLKAFPVPIPPLEEQTVIVDQLSAFDRAVGARHRRISALTRLFESALESVVDGSMDLMHLALPREQSIA